MRLCLGLLVYCASAWVLPFHSLVTSTQLTARSYLQIGRLAVYSNSDLPGPFNATITVQIAGYSEEAEAVQLAVAISPLQELEKEIQNSGPELWSGMCCEGPSCGLNISETLAIHQEQLRKNETMEWVSTK